MNDKTKQIIKFIEDGLSASETAKRVDCSRTWIYYILDKYNLTPKQKEYPPELLDPKIFEKSNEIIALELDLPITQVISARKKLNIKSPFKISLTRRRRSLVKSLFGDYLPGSNFVSFIREQIQQMSSELRRDMIEEFYLDGTTQSLADNVNSDSDRVYRVMVKKELKEIVNKFEIEKLIEQKIIERKETKNE